MLELIVALGVITTGVIGTVTLTTSSLASSIDTSNRVTATYLASEGIEIIRMFRDNNWQAGCPNPGLSVPPPPPVLLDWSSGVCFEWDTGLKVSPGMSLVPLFNPTTYRWSLSTGLYDLGSAATQIHQSTVGSNVWYQTLNTTSDPTLPYFRSITLQEICADNSISSSHCPVGEQIGLVVQSTVRWLEQGRTSEVTLTEKIYNWR